jgi:hypothetical protein
LDAEIAEPANKATYELDPVASVEAPRSSRS